MIAHKKSSPLSNWVVHDAGGDLQKTVQVVVGGVAAAVGGQQWIGIMQIGRVAYGDECEKVNDEFVLSHRSTVEWQTDGLGWVVCGPFCPLSNCPLCCTVRSLQTDERLPNAQMRLLGHGQLAIHLNYTGPPTKELILCGLAGLLQVHSHSINQYRPKAIWFNQFILTRTFYTAVQ